MENQSMMPLGAMVSCRPDMLGHKSNWMNWFRSQCIEHRITAGMLRKKAADGIILTINKIERYTRDLSLEVNRQLFGLGC